MRVSQCFSLHLPLRNAIPRCQVRQPKLAPEEAEELFQVRCLLSCLPYAGPYGRVHCRTVGARCSVLDLYQASCSVLQPDTLQNLALPHGALSLQAIRAAVAESHGLQVQRVAIVKPRSIPKTTASPGI